MAEDISIWQWCFNLAFSAFLGVLGFWFRQITEDLKLLRSDLENFKKEQLANNMKSVLDCHRCQEQLPRNYIPRQEYSEDLKDLKIMMKEQRDDLRRLFERLENKSS